MNVRHSSSSSSSSASSSSSSSSTSSSTLDAPHVKGLSKEDERAIRSGVYQLMIVLNAASGVELFTDWEKESRDEVLEGIALNWALPELPDHLKEYDLFDDAVDGAWALFRVLWANAFKPGAAPNCMSALRSALLKYCERTL